MAHLYALITRATEYKLHKVLNILQIDQNQEKVLKNELIVAKTYQLFLNFLGEVASGTDVLRNDQTINSSITDDQTNEGNDRVMFTREQENSAHLGCVIMADGRN